ncbi:M14 family zinc carboxypeptidase [Streptomyces sp. MI02-7b]|uniref:M14 family zinc carboxypeptidase n=1 Tax=Streptomyces sp. MI02-7b TaxID=462941 RepID=UPI0029B34FE5|nr:M14 family zinc carboxypeptidase [Streptomyces sp. MI02-7b]MDX3072106.1 M14 family zinc carboxypeptidase [Streptomyces sp. MI02-7b]
MRHPGETTAGDRYPTVDEVAAAARALTLRRPDLCRVRTVGTSRAGEPLLLLSVGHGRRNVLVVAGPHANEMVGGATALRLARWVAADPALREGADASWHFLLCADPDGARLNEAVPDGRFTMLGHYRHFFRPRAAEQPEWLPDDGSLAGALPETRALIAVIDELRPVLQCSLHGIDVGGSFIQVTRAIPRLAERIAKSAAEFDIPLEAGSSDAFHWPSPGPGVYVMPPPGGPREDASNSTWTYAHRYGGVTAIAEVPMWACDRAGDTSPHPAADEALRAAGVALRRTSDHVGGLIGELRPYLPGDGGPLLRAAREIVAVGPRLAADWDPALRTASAPPLPAMTRARVSSVEIYAQRLPLRAAAMLLRLARGVEPSQAPAAAVRECLERLVAEWCRAYETAHRARWVPVRHQTEQHARVVVAAFELLPG